MIEIKKFENVDAQKVSKLIIDIFKETNKDISKRGEEFFLKEHSPQNLIAKWKDTFAILVLDENKLIGVGRTKKNGWITHCFVDKEYRRKGIGKMIMKKLEKWLVEKNLKEIYLNSSPFALIFYKKLGYKLNSALKYEHHIPMYLMKKTF